MYGEGGKVGLSSLSAISKHTPSRRGLLSDKNQTGTYLTGPPFSTWPRLALMQHQTHRPAVQFPATLLTLLQHQRQPGDLVYLLRLSRQRG